MQDLEFLVNGFTWALPPRTPNTMIFFDVDSTKTSGKSLQRSLLVFIIVIDNINHKKMILKFTLKNDYIPYKFIRNPPTGRNKALN